MSIFHKSPGGVKQSHGGSAKVHIPAGSGSRPVKSSSPIMTSAPKHPHKLDGRHVRGALK